MQQVISLSVILRSLILYNYRTKKASFTFFELRLLFAYKAQSIEKIYTEDYAEIIQTLRNKQC